MEYSILILIWLMQNTRIHQCFSHQSWDPTTAAFGSSGITGTTSLGTGASVATLSWSTCVAVLWVGWLVYIKPKMQMANHFSQKKNIPWTMFYKSAVRLLVGQSLPCALSYLIVWHWCCHQSPRKTRWHLHHTATPCVKPLTIEDGQSEVGTGVPFLKHKLKNSINNGVLKNNEQTSKLSPFFLQ